MTSADPRRAALTAARSGVYRTPPDIRPLQHAADSTLWVELDVGSVGSKSELLELLARALAFPAGFGQNWDALADALQDLSWRPAEGYALQVIGAPHASNALGGEWTTFVDVLKASAAYWKTRGRAFVAFVDGSGELPAWT